MKKNISLLILIAIFSQLNSMEHKRKFDDFMGSDNQKNTAGNTGNTGNSNTKKTGGDDSVQAIILPEVTVLPGLLGVHNQIKLLILENNIRSIINNNDIFDSVAKISRFIRDVSLTHRTLKKLKPDLLKIAKKYLKKHFAKDVLIFSIQERSTLFQQFPLNNFFAKI